MKTPVRSLAFLAATALVAASLPAAAATLTAVPMQGGMVMPMIGYHASHGRLHVMMDPTVPQLTPLRISNPGDGFAAGDPWYDDLDPSRRGLAFSRRYGFVMDSGTDPLPEGTSIWLRRLSASPGLGFYRYMNTEPRMWEPIFGTAGSPAAWKWSGMMFHPGVTAPPGTNTLAATFEAILVDTATGLEVTESSTGPFVLEWTVVPDGRPALDIALRVAISWPAGTPAGTLESADAVDAAAWTPVPSAPVVVDGRPTVWVSPADAARVYRLRLDP